MYGFELDEKNLSKAEKQKILEVLTSQERVLTLLYDKTFPPRSQTTVVGVGGVRDLATRQKRSSKSAKGIYNKGKRAMSKESMR